MYRPHCSYKNQTGFSMHGYARSYHYKKDLNNRHYYNLPMHFRYMLHDKNNRQDSFLYYLLQQPVQEQGSLLLQTLHLRIATKNSAPQQNFLYQPIFHDVSLLWTQNKIITIKVLIHYLFLQHKSFNKQKSRINKAILQPITTF